MATTTKISWPVKIFWGLLIIVVSLNVAIQITDHGFVYKALIYTYADIDDIDIFDTRQVAHGDPQPWPMGSDYGKRTIPDSLKSTLERYETVEFLIVRNDSIRYEQYWDRYQANSLSNSFSVAKSITGTLVGIAVDEGLIKSIDEPISHYLDWLAKDESSSLTIRQVLTMSAELNWDEQYSSLFSITTKAYYGNNLNTIARSLKVVGTPGKVFNYQSGCTVLLAMLVEKATGRSVSEYASEKLWKPLGAEFSARWSLDHYDGQEKAFCCFYSTARDFARLGQLFLDSGTWKGRQIISKQWVADATTPAPLLDEDGTPNESYGYQWWITRYEGHKIFYARGLSGQYIVVIPDQRIVMVRLGRKRGNPKPGPGHHLEDLDLYIAEVMKMYAAS